MSKQDVKYPAIGDLCAQCRAEDGNANQLVWQRGEIWESGGRQWLCESCLEDGHGLT